MFALRRFAPILEIILEWYLLPEGGLTAWQVDSQPMSIAQLGVAVAAPTTPDLLRWSFGHRCLLGKPYSLKMR